MVSLLKHFSWMFAKVFISGKLFAGVLRLCKILKQGFPQGVILLFSFIFLLMPPINHELLPRCQRAAWLPDCKWQAMNNAHTSLAKRPPNASLLPLSCSLWSEDPFPGSLVSAWCQASPAVTRNPSQGLKSSGFMMVSGVRAPSQKTHKS